MLRWVDGFEHYGVIARMTEGIGGGAAWSDISTDAWALVTTSPATGDYHMRLTGQSSGGHDGKSMRRVWGVAKQVVGAGYRFAVADLPQHEAVLLDSGALVLADIRDVSNAHHIAILLGTDGSIIAKRGFIFNVEGGMGSVAANGTELGRSDPCVARGGYHHFEFKVKIDNTTGYIEVRINEVTVLNLTGIDTQSTANAEAAQFVTGESDFNTSGAAKPAGFITFDVDDAFAWDDDASDAENTVVDFVGDKGAYWLAPDGDTAESDFTITGSVTAYGAIDEVPPTGTEYLETAAATARTVVSLEPLPGNVADVVALVPILRVRKEESGTVIFRAGLISGGEETYGPEDNPSTAYAFLRGGPKTLDPDTGVPWANDAEPDLLIERTA